MFEYTLSSNVYDNYLMSRIKRGDLNRMKTNAYLNVFVIANLHL